MCRFVMFGYGVDAVHVTAVAHRASEQAPSATRPVVVSEFLDRVPLIRAVDLARDGRVLTAARAAIRTVLTP